MSKRYTSVLFHGSLKVMGLALMLAALNGSAFAGAGPGPKPSAVPEIDPSSILGAVTLLSGGLMVLTDRRRAK